MLNKHQLVGLSVLLHAVFLVYGEWQDATMSVKFTDIDYKVFTDASEFVSNGGSPYERATYRYTPLLAWMTTPNIFLHASFGKLLFVSLNILVGCIILRILEMTGCPQFSSLSFSAVWFLNPMTIVISARGNAESVMSFLVLLTVYLVMKRANVALSGALFALSVHFKIYPLMYSLPLYLYIGMYDGKCFSEFTSKQLDNGANAPHVLYVVSIVVNYFRNMVNLLQFLLPTKKQFQFVGSFLLTIISLTLFMYGLYGFAFLEHTYLYHLSRKDVKHNFSVYFYLLYLTNYVACPPLLSMMLFVPQLVMTGVVGFKFYKDPPFCCFLQTFLFVTLNKVCTSQYFIWYLTLLPICLPRIRISQTEAIVAFVFWMVAQSAWLLPAYMLEFQGKDAYLLIWIAGILFFLVNMALAAMLTAKYTYQHVLCIERISSETSPLKKRS